MPTSASSISFLEPAGLENAVGLISSSNQKDLMDVQWADDAGVKEYLASMKQYLPNADLNNSNQVPRHHATLLMKVLTACKGRLQPREHHPAGDLALQCLRYRRCCRG